MAYQDPREYVEAADPTTVVASLVQDKPPGEFPATDFSDGIFRAQRKYICDWESARFAVTAFLGGVRKTGGSTLVQRPWHYDINSRGWPYAIAVDASTRPLTGPVTSATDSMPSKAEIIVTYEWREYDDGTGSNLFVEEEWNPAAEFLTIDGKNLYWDDQQQDALSQVEAPSKVVRLGGWVVKQYWLTSIPSYVDNWQGRVNDSVLTSAKFGKTFAEETLLARSPVRERVMTATGVPAWNLELEFTYRESGWNRFFRKVGGGALAAEVIYDEAGIPFDPYDQEDFTRLIP